MNLSRGIIRPGKVLLVESNGEIKGTAPGLFSETDSPELLPPIYPFCGFNGQHANTYSEPKIGDDIWILNLKDNDRQLYWFRRDDFKTNNTDIISLGNAEIICNRTTESALLFFTDGSGWIMNNKGSFIQIDPQGNINVVNPGDTNINTDGNVYIGSGATREVARGPETTETLNAIVTALIDLAGNLNLGSVTSGAAASMLMADIPSIQTPIPDINEPKTFIR